MAALLPETKKPLASGPIAYYDGACMHCHGPYGSSYSDSFFKKFDLGPLSKSIKEMAEGPGQSPLDDEALGAQVAFHQAIIAHLPFIDWTGQEGSKLSGEVTKKATLVASINRDRLPVTVTGGKWSLELPAGAQLGDLVLTATLKGQSATWSPKNHSYSLPSAWPPVGNEGK